MDTVIPSEVEESRCENEKLAPRGPSTSPAAAGFARDDWRAELPRRQARRSSPLQSCLELV